jgi:hypothetical protein
MISRELRWGLIIGLANLVWLYGSFYLGMHSRGVAWIQVMGIVSILISVAGYVLAHREIIRAEPETTFIEGLKSGAIIAGVVAVCAVIVQVGYFKIVNPGWTDYMVEESRRHFEELGVPADKVPEYLENSRKTFSLGSYAIQASVGAFVIGMISSAITLLFLVRRRRK